MITTVSPQCFVLTVVLHEINTSSFDFILHFIGISFNLLPERETKGNCETFFFVIL